MNILRKNTSRIWHIGLLFSIVLIFGSCSTKKNNFFTRSFHNLTSYYNVYWNGRQALVDTENILKENLAENYFQVLPALEVGTIKDTALTSEKTSRIIEKSAKAIKKHSIIDKGEEKVKYIDDAYLLMAKGFFYKHDYSKSRMILNVVLSDFSDNSEYYEALLWQALTYIYEQEYGMAFALITKVDQGKSSAKKATRMLLPQVQADYYIAQEEYDLAVPYLKTALTLVKNSDQKARINFILGQIAQKNNKPKEAYNYYKNCIKLNPPLSMSFNAHFNRALCYDSKTVSAKDLIKALQKLLKDQKNSVYFGRIYYVLGEVAFVDKNEILAVEYMNKSIEASDGDAERMLLATKKLATYFYDKADYIQAAKYYEMAASVVKENDESFYDITSRAKYLAELMEHYEALTVSDTLKMLSKMSDAQLQQYAKGKVVEYKKQQEIEKRKAADAAASSASSNVSSSTSSWYFYSSQARSSGYNEFVRRWGRRKSEDLWCFASKPPMAALRAMQQEMDDKNQEEEEDKKDIPLGPEDQDFYLQNIPKDSAVLASIDSTIEISLFNTAFVYFDYLDEDKQGEKYFLRLLNEYPKSIYIPSVYENLCKIYHKRNDNSNYSKYAGLLASQYPETEQNKRINDPSYHAKLAAGEEQVLKWYEQAYELFSSNKYEEMLALVNKIEENYPFNNFRPQLIYLKAVGLAHISGYYEMITMLENFKKSYPNHELEEKIDVLLDRAKREVKRREKPLRDATASRAGGEMEMPSRTIKTSTNPREVKYVKKKASAVHYVALITNKNEVNKNVLEVKILDFCEKLYGEVSLDVSVNDYTDNEIIFLVSSFKNAKAAQDFYDMFKTNEYVFSGVNMAKSYLFIISEENLELLKSSYNPKDYKTYFETNY